MQTDGILSLAPPAPTQIAELTRVQEMAAQRAQSLDLTYTDASGQAFNLSLQRETSLYSFTYDRYAQLSSGVPGPGPEAPAGYGVALRDLRHQLDDLKHELKDTWHDLKHSARGLLDREEVKELGHAFRDLRHAVNGVKKLLHQFLKQADRGYADNYRTHDPVAAGIQAFEARHVEITVVRETVTLEMDVVDPEYWSVENTADRIADFAVGLYPGGDRSAHAAQMATAMETGYREAEEAFGGWLPAISRQTLDLALDLLQQWARGGAEGTEDAAEEGLDLVA